MFVFTATIKIKTNNVHLSFDLDVLNDDEFPAVNVLLHKTYVSGNGLSFDIVNKGLKLLFENLNITSMDILISSKIIQGEIPSIYNGLYESESKIVKTN